MKSLFALPVMLAFLIPGSPSFAGGQLDELLPEADAPVAGLEWAWACVALRDDNTGAFGVQVRAASKERAKQLTLAYCQRNTDWGVRCRVRGCENLPWF